MGLYRKEFQYVECTKCETQVNRLSGDWYTPAEIGVPLCARCYHEWANLSIVESVIPPEVTDSSFNYLEV